jgi:hypothetical protein
MDLFVEFKFADTSHPFCDPEDPLQAKVAEFCFESDTDHTRLVRGQLAFYAAAHAGCQFRVHIFCVLICTKYARFIHSDRNGATVTGRFDYIKRPHFLSGFFWRYERQYHLQKGYDTSILRVTPADIQQNHLFKGHLRKENPTHYEFHILMVPDRDEPMVEKQFIISFPLKYTARQ